jgi:hypothetical protein
MGFTPKPSGN